MARGKTPRLTVTGKLGSRRDGARRALNAGSDANSGSGLVLVAGYTETVRGESGSDGVSGVNSNRARCLGMFQFRRPFTTDAADET